ncbi:MAG: hypothetical protein ACFNTM_03675 [Cardiobacterium sp.]|jgi:hypothetical protein
MGIPLYRWVKVCHQFGNGLLAGNNMVNVIDGGIDENNTGIVLPFQHRLAQIGLRQ